MDIFEQIQHYISTQKYGFEVFCMALGIFFAWSAIGNWQWFYEPPYNATTNPIGYWFGRKAFRVTMFVIGVFLFVWSGWLLFL